MRSSISEPPLLADQVLRSLASLRRRGFAIDAAVAIGWTTFAAGVSTAIAFGLDRWFVLGVTERVLLTTSAVAVTGVVAIALLARALRARATLAVAERAESAAPSLDGRLRTLVEIGECPNARRRVSAELFSALEAETHSILAVSDPMRALPRGRAVAAVLAGAVTLFSVAAFAAASPRSFELLFDRFIHPATELPRPSTVVIAVQPGHATVAEGSEVAVIVDAVAGTPESATIAWRSDADSSGNELLEFRSSVAGGERRTATKTFRALTRSLSYRIFAGDAASPWYRIETRAPPRAKRFEIRVREPAYTGARERTIESADGSFRVLAGSGVALAIESDAALGAASLSLIREPSGTPESTGSPPHLEVPLRIEGRVIRTEEFTVAADLSRVQLTLVDESGVGNGGRHVVAIEVDSDRPPEITLRSPRPGSIPVEPESVLTFEYSARDDVGIAEIRLRIALEDESIEHRVRRESAVPPSADTEPARAITGRARLDLAALELQPGDGVTVELVAIDLRGNSGASTPRRLEVVDTPERSRSRAWLARLARAAAALELAANDGEAIARRAGSTTTESARDDASRLRAILVELEGIAGELDASARSLPNVGTTRIVLVRAARELRTIARGAGSAFWSDLRTLAEPGAGDEVSPADEADRFGGALDAVRITVNGTARSEEWSRLSEAVLALSRDARSFAATLAGRRDNGDRLATRARRLLVRGTRLAGAIAGAARNLPAAESEQKLSRAYQETVIPALAAIRDRLAAGDESEDIAALGAAAVTALDWARRDLDSAQRRQAEVRRRAEDRTLELNPLLDALTDAAAAAESDPAATAARAVARAAFEIEQESALSAGEPNADLETQRELQLLARVVEEWRSEIASAPGATGEKDEIASASSPAGGLASGAAPPAGLDTDAGHAFPERDEESRAERGRRIARVYRELRPAHEASLAAQLAADAATGSERVATRLARAPAWNRRALQNLRRTAEHVAASLSLARRRIDALERVATRDEERALLGSAARDGAAAEEACARVRDGIFRLADGVDAARGEESTDRSPVVADARTAVDQLDRVVESLGRYREGVAARAGSRGWLERAAAAISSRVRELARREAAHAASLAALLERAAGSGAPSPEASPSTELTIAHERIRLDVIDLARLLRREARFTRTREVDFARRLDRRAGELLALARGDMLRASERLAAAEEAPPGEFAPLIRAAADLESRAARRIEAIATALAADETQAIAIHAEAAVSDLAARLGDIDDDRPIEELLATARDLVQKTEHASSEIAQRARGDERVLPALERLGRAGDAFRAAVRAAESGDRLTTVAALDRGRGELLAAAQLVAALRERATDESERASAELAAEDPSDEASEAEKSRHRLHREIEAELARLAALARTQDEIDGALEALLGGDDVSEDDARTVAENEQSLLDALEESAITIEELVDLVARLLVIEREGRSLAAQLRAADPAPDAEDRADGTRIVREFTEAGFRISASLPQILTAYWSALRAGEELNAILRATPASTPAGSEAPGRGGEPAATDTPSESTANQPARAAGLAATRFSDRVSAVRQRALEAMTQAESGIGGASQRLQGMEAAVRETRDALERLESGDFRGARESHRRAMRSLAEATRALEGGGHFDALSSAADSEVRTDVAHGWEVVPRGDHIAHELRFSTPRGVLELPYSPRFRPLVRAYLRALEERGW